MNYETEYKKLKADIKKAYLFAQTDSTKAVLEHILPELKESEGERIRKELIHLVKKSNEYGGYALHTDEAYRMIGWLEKLKVFSEYGDGLYYFGNNVFTYVGNPTWDNVSWLEKQGEPKPAEWSKEDDVMVNDILRCLPAKSRPEYNQRRINWLKSLKGRVQPQPKQEWKQENREELTEFENAMMHIGGSFFGENADLDPNDTDTIKEQAKLLLELAPKTEWSEEDEKMCQNILECLRNGWKKLPADILKYESWLESLKDRYTWKPSEEQMEALWCATEKNLESDNANVVELRGKVLESLYHDLKKLTGE